MALYNDSWSMVPRCVWDDVGRNLDQYEFLVQDTEFVLRKFDADKLPRVGVVSKC